MPIASITQITQNIKRRSESTRKCYLALMESQAQAKPNRTKLSCSNLAHAMAACSVADKASFKGDDTPNLAIISAYNDMLSAHEPYKNYPDIIKNAAHENGATAQFAGGVPAMCDGITQGQAGMDLSLFSRDVIAMSSAIALSHDMFDGVLALGICDKIVPGLLIGALSFGHLPTAFIPAGPMESGLPNVEKNRIRELYAKGEVTREELLAAESASYHSSGTCTFYGTANSNQMLMEIMGLQLPSSSFVNPNSPLREKLTKEAVRVILAHKMPLYKVIDERAIVNAMIGLLATGGSTNHTIHLIAIARAAGIIINWDDFAALSDITPLLARIYPNGEADINQFHASGGMSYLIGELLDNDLLHADANSILGENSLSEYRKFAELKDGQLSWSCAAEKSLNDTIIASVKAPFSDDGGLKLLTGNLGRAIAKSSALKAEYMSVTAPAKVFYSQNELLDAFERGDLHCDFIAVLPYQGAKARGMPELHKLNAPLGVLQNLGYKIALITDGRMSGASGKIPAVIHITPEAINGGHIAKIRDGDVIELDISSGILQVKADIAERNITHPDLSHNERAMGRELFTNARKNVTSPEQGASFL